MLRSSRSPHNRAKAQPVKRSAQPYSSRASQQLPRNAVFVIDPNGGGAQVIVKQPGEARANDLAFSPTDARSPLRGRPHPRDNQLRTNRPAAAPFKDRPGRIVWAASPRPGR